MLRLIPSLPRLFEKFVSIAFVITCRSLFMTSALKSSDNSKICAKSVSAFVSLIRFDLAQILVVTSEPRRSGGLCYKIGSYSNLVLRQASSDTTLGNEGVPFHDRLV